MEISNTNTDLGKFYFPKGCPKCKREIVFVKWGSKYYYACAGCLDGKCQMYVRAHSKDSKYNRKDEPIGSFADDKLRELRKELNFYSAHLWMLPVNGHPKRINIIYPDYKTGEDDENIPNRTEVHMWLAELLKISFEQCRISLLDKKQCRKAIKICKSVSKKYKFNIPEDYLNKK